uniref:T9SS type A sorting domain-containing protein n=1 Tax=Algoriphagus sp. TaxID=1872435 RepID=UPI0040484530
MSLFNLLLDLFPRYDFCFFSKIRSSLFFWVVFLCVSIPSLAQSLSPSVINVGGLNTKAASFSLDFSIGEQSSITQYTASPSLSLTAGFLQAFSPLVTGLTRSPSNREVTLMLYPNPAADYTTLRGVLSAPGQLSFQLIDIQGRVLQSHPQQYFQNAVEKEFSIAELAAGMYFIRLIYAGEEGMQAMTLKLIKAYR